MAGELLRAVEKRQADTARAFSKLAEQMDQLATESFLKWQDEPAYHFQYQRVSSLYVRVELWRDDKPVAFAWVMYLVGRDYMKECNFAFLYDHVDGYPENSSTLEQLISVIADWLVIRIDGDERLGDQEQMEKFERIIAESR